MDRGSRFGVTASIGSLLPLGDRTLACFVRTTRRWQKQRLEPSDGQVDKHGWLAGQVLIRMPMTGTPENHGTVYPYLNPSLAL
ncbi:hypothetical protein LZ30DRAFT_50898 [Colletotrichum cereale]|nr:hypothetical protein LZ30DRAFT_50898 [Colletotrichum cereale]